MRRTSHEMIADRPITKRPYEILGHGPYPAVCLCPRRCFDRRRRDSRAGLRSTLAFQDVVRGHSGRLPVVSHSCVTDLPVFPPSAAASASMSALPTTTRPLSGSGGCVAARSCGLRPLWSDKRALVEAAGTSGHRDNDAQLTPELAAVHRPMASHFEGGVRVSLRSVIEASASGRVEIRFTNVHRPFRASGENRCHASNSWRNYDH